MAAAESKDETPSLGYVWRVQKEIQVNTYKLVQDVEALKGSYKDFNKRKPDFYAMPTKRKAPCLKKRS